VFLISAEHTLKRVHCGENHLRKLCAVCLAHLQRQNILEFMRDFAEFLKTAGRGVPFKGVNSASNAAQQLLIGGAFLELQAYIINDLEKFRGALKEESTELRAAILGQETQPFTSRRL
jgi:hypothetical protein